MVKLFRIESFLTLQIKPGTAFSDSALHVASPESKQEMIAFEILISQPSPWALANAASLNRSLPKKPLLQLLLQKSLLFSAHMQSKERKNVLWRLPDAAAVLATAWADAASSNRPPKPEKPVRLGLRRHLLQPQYLVPSLALHACQKRVQCCLGELQKRAPFPFTIVAIAAAVELNCWCTSYFFPIYFLAFPLFFHTDEEVIAPKSILKFRNLFCRHALKTFNFVTPTT